MEVLEDVVKSCYIHIPFCNKICSYCDFCKVLYDKRFISKYLVLIQITSHLIQHLFAMFSVDKMHFEISERKMILRLFDVAFVLVALYFTGQLFAFDYFVFSSTNYYWTIVLAIYINTFGTIFEIGFV